MNHFERSKILPVFVAGSFLNGVLDALIILLGGWNLSSALSCVLISLLMIISYIDIKTMLIAPGLNAAVFLLGILRTLCDRYDYPSHIIGMLSVSFIIFLLMLLSGGRAIGGGDMKLMAGVGLFLGWQAAVLSFILACFTAALMGLLRMIVKHGEKEFAFAPYITVGVLITLLMGDDIIAAYSGCL